VSYVLALHLLAQGSLVLDCAQTMQIKYHPMQHEVNPILGAHPGDAEVVAYFAAHIALQEAAYRWAPRSISTPLSIGTIVVEGMWIDNNFRKMGFHMRF
jgi:hypothetical protein